MSVGVTRRRWAALFSLRRHKPGGRDSGMSDQVLGGRYRLQRPLGRGATATVWQAWDTRLERGAAVKILNSRSRADPAALERLRREARSVARLARHNHLGEQRTPAARARWGL